MGTIKMDGKYQTRDGRAVRILCVDGPDGCWPVVGFIEGCKATLNWSFDGYSCKEGAPQEYDLVPVPTKHEGFIIVSRGGQTASLLTAAVYHSCEDANSRKYSAPYPEVWEVIPIAWED